MSEIVNLSSFQSFSCFPFLLTLIVQLVIEVARILYFKRIKYSVFLIEVSSMWLLENYHFTKSQRMKRITFCFIFLITFFNILPSKKYLVEVNNEKGNTTDELLPASSDEDATIDGIF